MKYSRTGPKHRNVIFTEHFIFYVFINHEKVLSHSTGVRWQSLFKKKTPIFTLNDKFWKDLKNIEQQYLGFTSPRKNNGPLSSAPIHYIAPLGWIKEINLDDRDSFIKSFLPRLEQLLLNQALSYLILEQAIELILNKIMQKHSWIKANQLGVCFLNVFINPFKKAPAEQWEFVSFVFNLLQDTLSKNGYSISVSKFLVHNQFSLAFLTNVYFSHPNNTAARQDFSRYFQKDDLLGKESINYTLTKQYHIEEIDYFRQVTRPLLISDEKKKEETIPIYKIPSDDLSGLPNDPAIVCVIPGPQVQTLRTSSNPQAFLTNLSPKQNESKMGHACDLSFLLG